MSALSLAEIMTLITQQLNVPWILLITLPLSNNSSGRVMYCFVYQLPAFSSEAFKFAVVDVSMVALILTGTKPSLAMNSSWLASAQTFKAVKKPVSFVSAKILYGVSASEIFASDNGALFLVWTRPVSTWFSQVQASRAVINVPLIHTLEQSRSWDRNS